MKTQRSRRSAKPRCEAQTQFCSGEILRRLGVNGSEKEGKSFLICGACYVILKRQGNRFKEVD